MRMQIWEMSEGWGSIFTKSQTLYFKEDAREMLAHSALKLKSIKPKKKRALIFFLMYHPIPFPSGSLP